MKTKNILTLSTVILLSFISSLYALTPINPCALFDYDTQVSDWPAIAGKSYFVSHQIWVMPQEDTNKDGVIDILDHADPIENCTITFIKPNGETFQITEVTIHPYPETGDPDSWKYHITLPCEFAQQGFASASVIVDTPFGCPNHDSYWFFVRSSDFNCDGIVNTIDLETLIQNWGSCNGQMCIQDMNIDDEVNVKDLLIVLENWGPTDG